MISRTLLSSCVGNHIANVETKEQFDKFLKHFKLYEVKRSKHLGYVSKNIYGELYRYEGRYGKGVVLFTNAVESTRYCIAIYYSKGV